MLDAMRALLSLALLTLYSRSTRAVRLGEPLDPHERDEDGNRIYKDMHDYSEQFEKMQVGYERRLKLSLVSSVVMACSAPSPAPLVRIGARSRPRVGPEPRASTPRGVIERDGGEGERVYIYVRNR